ncbi:MAG TPA: PP2C family protein-serine/threonine phosphatase [Solirubrobacterales bacterium]
MRSRRAQVACVCAAALFVFATWLLAGPSATAGVGFFYAIPVALAAWWLGPRAAAIALAASLVLYVIGSLLEPVPDLGLALPLRLLAWSVIAIAVSLVRERLSELEHSADELEAIRAALAPAGLPELPHVDAAAAFVPSELGVSGDFYLLTNAPDGSTVAIVGDVVGHGPQAARLATFVRARFAALAANTSDPAELLMLANRSLIDRPGRRKELVSAICLRMGEGAQLSWAVAGHPPPLRLPVLDTLEHGTKTFLLGADGGLELENANSALTDGEGVVVYTDGATDVRRGGDFLGLEGLTRILAPLAHESAGSMVAEAERAILEWTDGPIRDDLCLLVLRPR